MSERLKAPFPYFGGKARVAALVWDRIGDVDNFIEPFAGSAAVLLARPHPPRVETLNDLDCYCSNFWRAVKHDPEQVAEYADWPVNEADLHSRHRFLVGVSRPEPVVPEKFAADPLVREAYLAGYLGEHPSYAAAFRKRVRQDPDYYDVRMAGWWCWGACAWIGGGWCQSADRPERHQNSGPDLVHPQGKGVTGSGTLAHGERCPASAEPGGEGEGTGPRLVESRPRIDGHGHADGSCCVPIQPGVLADPPVSFCPTPAVPGGEGEGPGPSEKRPQIRGGGDRPGGHVHHGQGVHGAVPDSYRPPPAVLSQDGSEGGENPAEWEQMPQLGTGSHGGSPGRGVHGVADVPAVPGGAGGAGEGGLNEGKRPKLNGMMRGHEGQTFGGHGVHQDNVPAVPGGAGEGAGLSEQLPRLAGGKKTDTTMYAGHGVHAEKIPAVPGGEGEGAGLSGKMPAIGRGGEGQGPGSGMKGVLADLPDTHRPQLADAYSRGRGVHDDNHLSGEQPWEWEQRVYLGGVTCKGQGVTAGGGTCAQRRAWLLGWFGRLRDRLRTVRVCCGHWLRVCDSESVTTRLGTTGVFLDPPYPTHAADGTDSRAAGLYATDGHRDALDALRDEVLQWCRERGPDARYRIVVAGYESDGYASLVKDGWEEIAWRSQGGYGNRSKKGRANRDRERLWASPGCSERAKEPCPLFDWEG